MEQNINSEDKDFLVTYHVFGQPNPKWQRIIPAKDANEAFDKFKELRPKCVCSIRLADKEITGAAIASQL